MKAMYFAVFESGSSRHDRRLLTDENPSLLKFNSWIEEQRREIEYDICESVVVSNINYFTEP